jgi:SAM-dependent methyltransferase
VGSSDSAWKQLGREDPYFGVSSHDRFRSAAQAGPARDEFFGAGAAHIDRVLATARELVPSFSPQRALDFGCGVARLVIPLARVAAEVVGVDISPAMLAEARRNCSEAGITNASFCGAPAELSGAFDFIHSFIVFQHIPIDRGLELAEALLDRLCEGGIGALHFTYATTEPRWRRVLFRLCEKVPGVNMAANVMRGRPLTYPVMQMNRYPLNTLFAMLQARDCHRIVTSFSHHGGHLGLMLVFQRRRMISL